MNHGEFIRNEEFIHFNEAMLKLANNHQPNYSYLGFNFTKKEIVSTKCYYVFFGKLEFNYDFPILGLEQVYNEKIANCSPFHISTPLVFGGGITFAIKTDKKGVLTKAFFFRVKLDNRPLLNNLFELYPELNLDISDFEEGYGQYVFLKEGKITTSEYVYLVNTSKLNVFNEYSRLDYSKAPCVEISNAGSIEKSNQKFIALAGDEIRYKDFNDHIPFDLNEITSKWNFKSFATATQISSSQRSIYFFRNNILADDNESPVEQFIHQLNQ